MAQTGLFGGRPLSAADIGNNDTSVYRGPVYTLQSSTFWRLGPSDFKPEVAKSKMEQLAARVKAHYEQIGQEITIRQYRDEGGVRRLPLYTQGSHEFLSLVHTPPGESGRRGTIGIQADTPSAEPKVDHEVRELLEALGAKL